MPQSFDDACYDGYHAIRGRFLDGGLVPMPVAGPYPQAAVVARSHGGLMIEWVAWAAVRRGAPPEVPSPEPPNDNLIFLNGTQNGTFSQPEPGGVLLYGVQGIYFYIVLDPSQGLTDDLRTGKMPWDDSDAVEHYIPQSSFRTDLANPTPSGNGLGKHS